MGAREVADSAQKSKREMESRISALEIEKDRRQQEADEWQEVAMNTKREADMASKKALKACQDLDAEISTLQATKAAMQREADVKAESMARLKGNADDKTSELEVKIIEMQKRNEDVSRRIVAMEEEKARTVKEAEEGQEVAINTKRDGEAKIRELEQSLRSMTEEKATMQKELAALRGRDSEAAKRATLCSVLRN